MRHAILAICLGSLAAGCTFSLGGFPLASSKNVRFETETLRRGVEGRDCVYMLLFIPLGSLNPNIEEATD